MKRSDAWFLAVFLAATSCTSYRTITPPPPSRVASLNNANNELRLSQGVALGFECVTGWGNPCAQGEATIDDQKVAKVFPAHMNRLESYTEGTFAPTSYVVVGVSPGETTLRIPDETPLRVVVVP